MGPGYEPSQETAGYPVYEPIGYIDQAGSFHETALWDIRCDMVVDGSEIQKSPGDVYINTRSK